MDVSRAFDLNRALRYGYAAFSQAPGPLFLGGLLFWFSSNSSSGFNFNLGDLDALDGLLGGDGPQDFDWSGDPDLAPPQELLDLLNGADMEMLGVAVLGTLICGFAVFAFFFCLNAWLRVGWLRTHREVIRSGDVDFGPLFSGGDRFFDMAMWRLLRGFILLGTTAVALSPAMGLALMAYKTEQTLLLPVAGILALGCAAPAVLYVSLGLMLGDHALVFEGLSPMEALDRAWGLAEGNRLTFLVFWIVFEVIYWGATLVGMMLLCFGVFVTGPLAVAVTQTGLSSCFLLVSEGEEAASSWAMVQAQGL